MDGGSSPLTSIASSPSPPASPTRLRLNVSLGTREVLKTARIEPEVIPDSDEECDNNLAVPSKDLDEHRDKRPRIEDGLIRDTSVEEILKENDKFLDHQSLPSPFEPPLDISRPVEILQEPAINTMEQDILHLFDDVDLDDFSLLPSSDPQPSRHIQYDMTTIEAEEELLVPPNEEGLDGNGADDSGIFFKVNESEEGRIMERTGKAQVNMKVVSFPEENYGDEMWIGYEGEAAVDLGTGLGSDLPPYVKVANIANIESEEEGDYSRDWDEGKSYPGFDFGAMSDNPGFGTADVGFGGAGGFITARGKGLAGPSKANLAKIQARLEHPSPPSSETSTTNATRPISEAHVSSTKPLAPEEFAPISLQSLPFANDTTLSAAPMFSGFSSGSGKPVAGASKESVQKSLAMIDGPSQFAILPLAANTTSNFSGFSSGSGKPVAGASKESVQKSLATIDGPPDSRASISGFVNAWGHSLQASIDSRAKSKQMLELSSPPAAPQNEGPSLYKPILPALPFAGFKRPEGGKGKSKEMEDVFDAPAGGLSRSGSGLFANATTVPSTSPVTRVPFQGMNDNSRPISPKRLSVGTSSPVSRDPVVSSPKSEISLHSMLPKQKEIIQATPKTFRPPLLSNNTKPYTPIASTSKLPARLPALKSTIKAFRSPFLVPPSDSKSTPTSKVKSKPAPALRRINVAMQSPKPRTPSKYSFSTPFKNGVRPVALSESVTPVIVDKGKGKQVIDRSTVEAVFDLHGRLDRVSMRDYGLVPLKYYYEDLQRSGIPEVILCMTGSAPPKGSHIKGAAGYLFEEAKGESTAFAALTEVGCQISLAWVQNHWALILWKLASIIRTKPDELSLWNWEVVYNQLLYRYEREINNAQRSCIKRIQEHDSSPLPMILCVANIRWGEAANATSGDDTPQVVVGFELTDGWYRIRAGIDDTLRNACMRGKIVVGSKLVIIGARRESPREGSDVLEALSISTLTISGNSTTLAPWDSTLGFVQQTFVASLESVTPAGGVIASMDIVINKIFPYGYIDLSKNGHRETWNEEEEVVREENYKSGRQKAQARLAEELEKAGDEYQILRDVFEEAVNRVGPRPLGSPTGSDSGEEADEILDRLEDSDHKGALIRSLSARQIHDCLKLIGENAERARSEAIMNLDKELINAFPPRDVRGFRVVRISNGLIGKKSSVRTAQLTIWDANSEGTDFFLEGKRYMVTNVIPKGTWKRTNLDITLSTRRDTRWLLK